MENYKDGNFQEIEMVSLILNLIMMGLEIVYGKTYFILRTNTMNAALKGFYN